MTRHLEYGYECIREGAFDFWHAIVPEKTAGCWIYRFYGAAFMVVIHANKKIDMNSLSPWG